MPPRGDSKEYKQYTMFNIKKQITINYPKSGPMIFFFKRLKNELEIAGVNEPLVFEPLKFHCSTVKTVEVLLQSFLVIQT